MASHRLTRSELVEQIAANMNALKTAYQQHLHDELALRCMGAASSARSTSVARSSSSASSSSSQSKPRPPKEILPAVPTKPVTMGAAEQPSRSIDKAGSDHAEGDERGLKRMKLSNGSASGSARARGSDGAKGGENPFHCSSNGHYQTAAAAAAGAAEDAEAEMEAYGALRDERSNEILMRVRITDPHQVTHPCTTLHQHCMNST